MEKKLKLAFQGSRSLKKKKEEVLKIIEREIEKHKPEIVITSGAPDGVCRLTQLYCKQNGITLKLYNLNFKKYARGAFEHRSINIIKESDYIILIHDGKSKGTRNELKLTRKYGKLYRYYKLNIAEHEQSIDFKTDEGWEMNDKDFKDR